MGLARKRLGIIVVCGTSVSKTVILCNEISGVSRRLPQALPFRLFIYLVPGRYFPPSPRRARASAESSCKNHQPVLEQGEAFGGNKKKNTPALVLIILCSAPLHASWILHVDFPKARLTRLPSEFKMIYRRTDSNIYRLNAKLCFNDDRGFLESRFSTLAMT